MSKRKKRYAVVAGSIGAVALAGAGLANGVGDGDGEDRIDAVVDRLVEEGVLDDGERQDAASVLSDFAEERRTEMQAEHEARQDERIDEAERQVRLDEETADRLREDAADRVDAMLVGERPEPPVGVGPAGGFGHGEHGRGAPGHGRGLDFGGALGGRGGVDGQSGAAQTATGPTATYVGA